MKGVTMPFWERWTNALRARSEATPEIVVPVLPEIDEPADQIADGQADSEDYDLEGMFFAIEYIDSNGSISRRRVTANLIRKRGEKLYLLTYCHERKFIRTFRMDRIVNMIFADGEILSVPEFARSIGVPENFVPKEFLDQTLSTSAHARPRERAPGLDQRALVRDEIRVLAGLSRSDGNMRDEEVDEIVSYIEEECMAARVAFAQDDRSAIIPYIKRLRPSADRIAESLDTLFGYSGMLVSDPGRWANFHRAMKSLACADGILHAEEIEFIQEVEARLSVSNRRGHAGSSS